MSTFTSQEKFYIDYSGGNFQLKRVDTLDEDDDSDVEVKTAVGVSAAPATSTRRAAARSSSKSTARASPKWTIAG